MFLSLTCLVSDENGNNIPQPCRINTNYIVSIRRGTIKVKGHTKEVTVINADKYEYMVIESYNLVSGLIDSLDELELKKMIKDGGKQELYPIR